MTTTPPLPASGSYIQAIRESCRALRKSAGITIESHDIQRLLTSPSFTSSFSRVSKLHGLAMPLNFPNHQSELNLLSVLSLLNFASGYRSVLHAQTGRGAWDNVRALVFGMFLMSTVEDDLLSAKGMKKITDEKIAELLRVNIFEEAPHETIPAVTVGRVGGPMFELVQLIRQVLNETGEVLVNSGYVDLGSFVLESLKQAEKVSSAEKPNDAVNVVLERLVRAFPGFRDMDIVGGQPVYCFKKALFLIHAINVRFGSFSPQPFFIPDTRDIPVFTDNVLPSMLVHLGVLKSEHFPISPANKLESLLDVAPSASPEAKPEVKDGPNLTTHQAYVLRAAAIDACELIVEESRNSGGNLSLPDLDMWLWSVAKDRRDYRELERFVLRNTVFF